MNKWRPENPKKLNTEMYVWCLEHLNKLNIEMYVWCLEHLNKLNIDMFILCLELQNKLNTKMSIWCREPLIKLNTDMCIWYLESPNKLDVHLVYTTPDKAKNSLAIVLHDLLRFTDSDYGIFKLVFIYKNQLIKKKQLCPTIRKNNGNNKITELRTILQRESQNS